MANITNEHEALVRRILEGEGRAPHAQRRAAFDNSGLTGPLRTLIEKLAKRAYTVTDEDIAAARSSGLTEDQIFELAVCAAVGQATRQYETALAALGAATGGSPHASRHPR
jgi:alkylhydroperoxidase family enzyme